MCSINSMCDYYIIITPGLNIYIYIYIFLKILKLNCALAWCLIESMGCLTLFCRDIKVKRKTLGFFKARLLLHVCASLSFLIIDCLCPAARPAACPHVLKQCVRVAHWLRQRCPDYAVSVSHPLFPLQFFLSSEKTVNQRECFLF